MSTEKGIKRQEKSIIFEHFFRGMSGVYEIGQGVCGGRPMVAPTLTNFT